MREPEPTQPEGPTWRNMAVGAGTVVLAVSGYLAGDTLSSLRDEQRATRAIIEARASLPARIEALERRHEVLEQRIREVEQYQWRNGDKH